MGERKSFDIYLFGQKITGIRPLQYKKIIKQNMKVTAIYQKEGANPFLERDGDYKRLTGLVPAGYDIDEIEHYAIAATPIGYLFVGLERAE